MTESYYDAMMMMITMMNDNKSIINVSPSMQQPYILALYICVCVCVVPFSQKNMMIIMR